MYLPDSEQVPCKQVFFKKKKKVKMKGKNGGWGEGAHVFKANIIH